MPKAIPISESTSKKLNEISKKRKKEDNLIRNQKDITADLIDKLYSKEIKS